MKMPHCSSKAKARTHARRRACGIASIRALAGDSQPSRNFRQICQSHRRSAVCEVNSAEKARVAAAHGCPAVAVRTWSDQDGDLFADLLDVRSATDAPVLQRDLVVAEYQVWEARAFGADAVTLLPALAEPVQLAQFAALAEALRMTPVFEIYDEEDAEVALDLGAQVTVVAGASPDKVRKIREDLPPTLLALSETGGDMALIGESLLVPHQATLGR